jgi:hypothetical protein
MVAIEKRLRPTLIAAAVIELSLQLGVFERM